MDRISKQQLQALCDRINQSCGTPLVPYAKTDSGYVPQAKCYHLSGAYGGYALHQMCDVGSGVHDIFGGHMPKRELYYRMRAFLDGIKSKAA